LKKLKRLASRESRAKMNSYQLPPKFIIDELIENGRTKYSHEYLVAVLAEMRELQAKHDELEIYADIPVAEFKQRSGDMFPVNNWLKVIKALKKALGIK
jgi:hypothetical protein